MNSPNDKLLDDTELAAYLKRDSAYSQRYQSLDADDVPVEMDQLILQRATSAAVPPGNVSSLRLRKWQRFSVPFALAATMVLGISIMMRMPETSVQHSASNSVGEPPVKMDLPAPPPAALAPKISNIELEAPKAEIMDERKLDVAAPAKVEELRREVQRVEIAAERPAAPTPNVATTSVATNSSGIALPTSALSSSTAKAAALKQSSQLADAKEKKLENADIEITVTGYRQSRTVEQNSPSPVTTISSENLEQTRNENIEEAVVTHDTRSKKQVRKDREADPEAWLSYIRELRLAKKNFSANGEWTRFVKAYPNYEVAADDVARGKN